MYFNTIGYKIDFHYYIYIRLKEIKHALDRCPSASCLALDVYLLNNHEAISCLINYVQLCDTCTSIYIIGHYCIISLWSTEAASVLSYFW